MHPTILPTVVNRLLASLPRAEYKRLSPDLNPIALTFGKVLYEPGDTIKHVYFPNDSIISLTRALVQGAGSAMRMPAAAVREEANRLGPFHQLLHRYSHSLQSQVSQSSACNRFHSVNGRLARWLLMTSDRLGTDEFRLT